MSRETRKRKNDGPTIQPIEIEIPDENVDEEKDPRILTSETTKKSIRIRLHEEVVEPFYYDQILDTIREAEKGDTVVIDLWTPGGVMDTGIMLFNVLRECKAKTVAEVTEASSAGSIIALGCDKVLMKPMSRMMIHQYKAGSYGSGKELKLRQKFDERYFEEVMFTVYSGFLTDDEINGVIHNAEDMWLMKEEVDERLEKIGRKG